MRAFFHVTDLRREALIRPSGTFSHCVPQREKGKGHQERSPAASAASVSIPAQSFASISFFGAIHDPPTANAIAKYVDVLKSVKG